MPDCSIIIPTRDRAAVLGDTLARLRALPDGPFEVLIVDNGSATSLPRVDDARVRVIRLSDNRGAAARNVAALEARGRVLFMLDDDSWPEAGVLDAAVARLDGRPDLGAVACRVRLADPPNRHDAGGVPGVFFNCGAAIRRDAFVAAGCFPADYGYYVEEYALSCELWRRGLRVEAHGDLVVWHRRTSANRDNDRMVRLLVRNNLRLWRKYAPPEIRDELIAQAIDRYRRVARLECAAAGFEQGLAEAGRDALEATGASVPLTMHQFECLFGLGAARRILREWTDKHRVRCAAVWSRGKGCEQVVSEIISLGIEVAAVYDAPRSIGQDAAWRGLRLLSFDRFTAAGIDGVVVGSLSPGVAEDALVELASRAGGLPCVGPAPWLGAGTADGAGESPEPAYARKARTRMSSKRVAIQPGR